MMSSNRRVVLLSTVVGILLTGCGGATDTPSLQQPSTAPPPAATPAPTPSNSPPTISGVPASTVTAGSTYAFTPTASDPEGNPVGFSISGKPSWATFNVATGALAGTPTSAQAGTYANIVISVSDGATTRALPAFTIMVTEPASAGTAVLSWTAPTQNTDETEVTNLAGYRVFHGTSESALEDTFQVPGPANTSYTLTGLGSGTHYFAVAAYTATGAEGARSAVGSKTIP